MDRRKLLGLGAGLILLPESLSALEVKEVKSESITEGKHKGCYRTTVDYSADATDKSLFQVVYHVELYHEFLSVFEKCTVGEETVDEKGITRPEHVVMTMGGATLDINYDTRYHYDPERKLYVKQDSYKGGKLSALRGLINIDIPFSQSSFEVGENNVRYSTTYDLGIDFVDKILAGVQEKDIPEMMKNFEKRAIEKYPEPDEALERKLGL